MRKKNKLFYINANSQEYEYVYTGIAFSEFTEYLQKPIKNILLLKSDFLGELCIKNFEAVEGNANINMLKKEDIYSYGDFCFVDYEQKDNVRSLNDEQIAELLFMAHMYRPLRTPFFENLGNRFAYLAHDDSFFCKVYCRKPDDVLCMINGKIVSEIENIFNVLMNDIDIAVQREMLILAERGVLLDFDEISISSNKISLPVFSVGKFTDMDKVINEYETLKTNDVNPKCIQYEKGSWCIVDTQRQNRSGDE